MSDKQACKVFCGGLSWETSSERLRAYFENFGVVREAFVSYNRNNGRPRGFGFVVFESPDVADKVVSTKHTIDRREVECKKAVPKEEQPPSQSGPPSSTEGAQPSSSQSNRTRKVFVGGLAPGVDEKVLRQHFEQFGTVEDAVVMYDHDNKRPRGFGFVTFTAEDSVEKVFARGSMQTILDKQIEIKPAVPRDQMPAPPPPPPGRGMPPYFDPSRGFAAGRGYGPAAGYGNPMLGGMYGGFGPRGPPGFGSPGPKGMQGGFGGGYRDTGMGRGGMQGRSGQQQAYMQGMGGQGAGGFAGGPRGPYNPSMGKMPAGYEQLYGGALPNSGQGAGGMFPAGGTSAATLYNLAGGGFQPHLGAMQQQGGPKLNAAQALGQFNQLKGTLNALASLGAFPGQGEGFGEGAGASAGYTAQDATAEYAEAAAAAAAAAAGGLGVQPDYSSFHDTAGFTTSPAPGWSS